MLPKFIYKYKRISSTEDLVRLMDIINYNRIYLPTYRELNDPLEGQIISIETDHYMGSSILSAADEEDSIISDCKKNFRILSLSEEWNNPQLWAHYANNYEGICMCFATGGVFGKSRKVNYCLEREDKYTECGSEIEKLVRKSFYKKSIGWNYEKEWRIVTKSPNKYMKFQEEDFCGLILGHNLSEEVCDFIKDNLKRELLLMKTKVGYRTYKINALRLNYKYDYNGAQIKVLDVEKTLMNHKYIYVKDLIK